MTSTPLRLALFFLVPLVPLASSCVPDADRHERGIEAYLRIVEAEDSRPESGRALDLLLTTASEGDVFQRASAVRALGRLENPAVSPTIRESLSDPAPRVRLEAAHALAQAYQNADGSPAFAPLRARLEIEPDPEVKGELARSIGRLRLSDEASTDRLELLLDATRDGGEDAAYPALVGALLGLEALVRGSDAGSDAGSDGRLVRRMMELSAYTGHNYLGVESVRVRTLSLSILGQAELMTTEIVQRALRDAAPAVPAVAIRYLEQIPAMARPETLRRAVTSESLQGVIEAFRYLAAAPRTETTCRYLLSGARVTPPGSPRPVPEPIRVLAIDGLSVPCPDLELQRTFLRQVVETLNDDPVRWQPAAHALLALARIDAPQATLHLPEHAVHGNPFVRAYAARTATVLRDRGLLRALLEDESDNVRTAAVEGLFSLEGHDADDALIAQLVRDDPQLLMTVARLLAGTPREAEAAGRLMDAFDRISAARRETWRDARAALVERLTELGSSALSERMMPYLADYDEQIADAAGGALRRWNGRPYTPTPLALPREPLPSAEEMRAMDGARIVLHMQGGGRIEIALMPYLSTTNSYRFWRLARAGYFDGLTFHRWAPNFVIQGGSPGANEYQGDGPFTRDEVGRVPHWRGTVGISTRGHDTGDGQIFVNLLDNFRLDHTYTIVGAVVDGMDVVDQVLEGAVIERAEVVPAG
jgi:cyclophilin family peptidyl-prolyl cis-trans isomerase/HEAT repeat protein